jgi:sec-independent protein translocase protein TatB
MNVLGIGTGELLLILLIILLVMGPERLPQLARQWGKMVRVLSRFTRTWHEISAEINRQMNLEDLAGASPKPKPTSPPTPPAPEPDESNNIIAPPNLQQPSVPQPKGNAEALTSPSEPAVDSLPVDGDLTPGAARPSNPAEPIHE